MRKSAILLVDNELDLKASFQYLHTDNGFEVDTSSNGKDALQLVKTKPFDLIITEMQLTNDSGIELIQDIRRLGITTPIFILSSDHPISKRTAEVLGATDFFEKSNTDLLLKEIRQYLKS